MLLRPQDLYQDLNKLEEIERASLRLVVQALLDYRAAAQEIFRQEGEEFRTRLSFKRLQAKARWRVQKIPMPPGEFVWEK